MHHHLTIFLLFIVFVGMAAAQAPGVPVYAEGRGSRAQAALMQKAKELKEANALLSMEKVKEQTQRTICELSLPAAGKQKLEGRELWEHSRKSHVRIGWHYLCTKCNRWHLNLSGGYAITGDTVVTCAHVLEPLDMREGYLIAADDDDNVIPATEVLAVNRAFDTAIVRLKTDKLTPLPLGTDVAPGDTVFCFSDPMGRRGFFSQGIVNRFVKRPFLRKRDLSTEEKAQPVGTEAPVWMIVSTDWAPGSSGSAVLDVFGNAVGHVSEIESVLEDPKPNAKTDEAKQRGTYIVFHDAIAAANVLKLIKLPAKPQP